MHYLALLWHGLVAIWAVLIGFMVLLFICHLAECWLTSRTRKADGQLLTDPRVLAPVARRTAEVRAELKVVRGDVKRRTGLGRTSPTGEKPRRHYGQRRVQMITRPQGISQG